MRLNYKKIFLQKNHIIFTFLFTIIFIFGIFFLVNIHLIAAAESNNIKSTAQETKWYRLKIDKNTIARGYTVSAFAEKIKLSLVPGILSAATPVEIAKLNEKLPLPWSLDKLSAVYQFEFKNKSAYDNSRPFYIELHYDLASNAYKQVFFYDKNYSAWRPLPTKDYPQEKFVRSLIHLPFARIAVFSFPDTLIVGHASWYGYKGGNFAASPDFPVNSRLRVHNLDNGKFIDVVVNDYGPDRGQFPNRAIDLDKTAFARIASLSDGIANVYIEPLIITADAKQLVKVPATGIGVEPEIITRAAVVLNAANSQIIWSKNATATMSIASLSKLVAIKIFLDHQSDLTKTVTYKQADEDYNYQYVKKWESAKLNIKEGEKLTIKDLLYSALIGSANNAVESLVRVSGITREEFIGAMNDFALSLGATSTHFIEPTGLSPQNVSSAKDYAIITNEVFKNKIIKDATGQEEYIFYTIGDKKRHRIRNTNKLLFAHHYNIVAGKTGYLDEAGYCLVIQAEKNNKKIIVITLNAPKRETGFLETERLLRFGLRSI